MSERWWNAKQEIAAYKAHISGCPSGTPRAYTLTKTQLEQLLNQKTGGLDGIRIYLGATTVSGVMVPTVSIVGTELVNGVQEDYGIPPVIEDPANALRSGGLSARSGGLASLNGEGEPGGGGEGEEEEEEISLAEPLPCPVMCGADNCLNSEE